MKHLCLSLIALSTFTTAPALACSFTELGFSIGNINAVTQAAMKSEDFMSSIISIRQVKGDTNFRFAVILKDETGKLSKSLYRVEWKDRDEEDGISCPSPEATKIN